MNNFDLMIEKYRNELMQAKKRSIINEIEEVGKEVEEVEQAEKIIDDEIASAVAESQEEEESIAVGVHVHKPKKMSDDIFEEPDDNIPGNYTGTLKIQIFAADQVYPVQSAHVVVKKSRTGEVIYDGYSDSSGIVDGISLATPSSEISQSPSNGTELAYSEVDILIEHQRFITVKYIKVTVFSGVE